MDNFGAVICLWEYKEAKNNYEDKWHLVKSFVVDDDGHPIFKKDANLEEDFMFVRYPDDEDEDDDSLDFVEHMGRAVTIWNPESGAWLKAFHPPKFVPWLAPHFYDHLRKSREWGLILGAHEMYLGTIREAENYITFHQEKQGKK